MKKPTAIELAATNAGTTSRGFVIAILGAESTGKTTLAHGISDTLVREGHDVALVGEYLREFCSREGRTPRVDEQRAIAAEQTHRVELAARAHGIVVADTTALMIAVYSDMVFDDLSLYESAIADHARCDLTLLTALDVPWQADGLQRDGPHVRGPVDAKVRRALRDAQIAHAVVAGTGDERLTAALRSVRHALQLVPNDIASTETRGNWHWICERCGDPACELHLFAALDTGAGAER